MSLTDAVNSDDIIGRLLNNTDAGSAVNYAAGPDAEVRDGLAAL